MILDDKRIEHDLPETAIKALNKVLVNFDKVFKTLKIKTMLFLIFAQFLLNHYQTPESKTTRGF